MIDLTQAAAAEIRRIQHSREQQDSCFRIGVKTGGCSGLVYILELAESSQTGDRVYKSNNITIVVDEQSSPYLTALKLDFSEDLMGGGFRFHNPNTSTACSCGQSFTPATWYLCSVTCGISDRIRRSQESGEEIKRDWNIL